MKSFTELSKALAIAVVALAFSLTSCGGGSSGGGTIPPGTTAVFTALAQNPGVGSISMQPGTASGDTFSVRIVATGVANLFGTAFHVIYNPNSATFVPPQDSTGSVLLETGTSTSFNASLVAPGNVAVVATRLQDGTGSLTGYSGSGDVIVLTFRATARTTANAFSFGAPREACDPTALSCVAVSSTWHGGTLTY